MPDRKSNSRFLLRRLRRRRNRPSAQPSQISFQQRNLIVSIAWNEAYNNALRAAHEKAWHAHPLLKGIRTYKTEYPGSIRNVAGENPVDQPMESHEFVAALSDTAIEAFDVAEHKRFIEDVVGQAINAAIRTLLRGVGATTEAVGNVVDAKGESLTVEQVRDLIIRTAHFDREGNLQLQQIVVTGNVPQEQRAAIQDVFNKALRDPETQRVIGEKRREWSETRKRRLL